MEGLLTSKEAASYLRVSYETLNKLRKEGKISYMVLGRGYMFRQADLDAFVEELINLPTAQVENRREVRIRETGYRYAGKCRLIT